MFLFLIISSIILGYLWLQHRYSYWERRGVKGPKPVFFFGNLFKSLTFQEHMSVAHSRWYSKYNDAPYIGFYRNLQPAVMIRDPELQREILVKAFMNFHENDGSVSDDDDLRKTTPFFNSGEKWQRNRAFFGAFFSANKTRRMFPRMLQVGEAWEKYVRSLGTNAEVDAKDICSRYTVETMVRCTFSIDAKSFEQQSDFLDFDRLILSFNPVVALKMMATFFVQDIVKLFNITLLSSATSDRFKQIVLDQIKVRASGSVQCDDLLQIIMDNREKYNLSDVEIAGTCFALFFQSHDTFPNTLVVALYQLAKNKHIQDKLAQSIEESIATNNADITYDLINKHEYGAEALKDPKFYPNPDVFDPERFSAEQKALRPKSAFMPFGDGPRFCIAMQMALFNLKMGLFEMIRKFDIRLGPNNKPFELHPMSLAHVPKNGVKLILTPRNVV